MKVEKIEPKVSTYRLVLDKGDEEFTSCIWARFILDFDNWRLTINSDAGDYTYGWGSNKNDDFLDLMCRVNADYLLNKMSDRSRVFIDKSKKATIKTITDNDYECFGIKDQNHLNEIIDEINDIDACASEETFIREVDSIVPNIDFECIEVVKDYPYGAYTAIGLFVKYIQPVLRAELKERS
jgi:hypothetical protein